MHPDLAKFLNIVSIPISGLFAYLNISEFYTVKIKNNVENYPFGQEGPVPYFYKTAELYATVNLSYGLVFLFLFLLGVWNIKTKKINGHLLLMIIIGLIFIKIFHGLSN